MPRRPITVNVAARGPGRPRSEKARKAILKSTLELLKRDGFNDLCIEAVAARAGVGKATVYRWWPNKAELVIDAFASAVSKELRFPPAGSLQHAVRRQMKRWAVIFRSPLGQIIANVIGAGQSDPEILRAFQNHWVEPRRMEARRLLRQAMKNGEIRPDLNPDTILDIFYGPLYLRLLVRNAPLTENFVDLVFDVVLSGLGT
jgi:AcrR family transcriptional regulator